MANITFTNTGYTTMFSDGPETITGSQYQTLLKYMKNNSEIYMPQNQKINLGMYHNNGNSTGNLIFGFVVSNEGNSTATIKSTKYTVRTAPSVDANSVYEKIDMATTLERDFLNGSVSSITTSIPANSKKFIMSCKVPYKTLVIERAEISCDSSKCKIRAVCGPYDNAASLVNKFWTSTEGNCSTGQFSGVVDYTQKNTTIDTNSISEFIIGDVNSKYDTNPGTEYTTVYYAKPNGKKYFAGNYAIIYNITLKNCANKTLTITPYWISSNPSARIVLYNPNIQSSWYTTNRLDGKGSWKTPLGSSNSTTIKFLLPGANCGKMTFKIS